MGLFHSFLVPLYRFPITMSGWENSEDCCSCCSLFMCSKPPKACAGAQCDKDSPTSCVTSVAARSSNPPGPSSARSDASCSLPCQDGGGVFIASGGTATFTDNCFLHDNQARGVRCRPSALARPVCHRPDQRLFAASLAAGWRIVHWTWCPGFP